MKIGLVLPEQPVDAGGAYTLGPGLVRALPNLKSETSHQWVLMGQSSEKPEFLPDMPWISLKPRMEKKGKIRREIERIIKKIVPSRATDSRMLLLDFERAPQVGAADLDLIVYLDPFVSPFLDIPYIINVWDMGHRVLPFFPELSLAGGWEIRERHFRERLQRAAYVIAPNASFQQDLIDFYQVQAERIRLLHHPTPGDVLRRDHDPVDKTVLAGLGLKGDFLFCPAQFWPHKNHMLLLRMLKVLKEKHGYEPQLVLTGGDKPLFLYSTAGNLSHIQQQARALGLEKQVVFAGFVSREVVIALYRAAVALVFPSFLGPENLPPLEAFALGCPVVTSRLPGSMEQYGDAALQIDPKAPELWARAVQELRQDASLRETLVAKGKLRAGQFTSEDFMRGLLKICDEFEPYRCNWTSALTGLPLEPNRRMPRLPSWESRYTLPR